MNLIEKMFGTHSERELKLIYPIVDKIVALKPEMEKLTDDELKDNTRKFRERLEKGETLDDILPEAFATIREASRRVLNMEHYPVQLIGGIVLHQGRIAEMYLSLRLTTIWQSEMPSGWERFTDSWDFPSAWY